MKFGFSLLISILCFFIIPEISAEWFPLDSEQNIPTLKEFRKNQELLVECMNREIDNGEHRQDAKGNIIFKPFPVCRETGKPLSLKYGVSEDINCTIPLTDEMYHLFQLYVHEDAPFSCRLPISAEHDSVVNGNGYVPMDLNFRGVLSDSHTHIDTSMNLLIVKPNNFNSIISSVGWSSSTNTTRYVIGDYMTLQFAVRWLDVESQRGSGHHFKYYNDGFYSLPKNINDQGITASQLLFYALITVLFTGAGVYAVLYARFNKRLIRDLGFKPVNDFGVAKKD
ncbi:hypothetical protein PACTADRAFT_48565 [Pachysolen tannophilus NRRL Y-2460]|uniref:Autophagy-related protein 27 n=1 Tax=Pachysolen tannophilus NRRL Y-2460 TaxID=669874 RepID=A0A1E4TYC4_PACTA|nr:hypothetical protein PACTADRAFT_48565 [Pachysolen tannophilus NRRL Y-2460]